MVQDKPNITYSDIGGLDSQKQEVREAVELPLTHMNMYKSIGIDPPRNRSEQTVPSKGQSLTVCNQFINVVLMKMLQKSKSVVGSLRRVVTS